MPHRCPIKHTTTQVVAKDSRIKGITNKYITIQTIFLKIKILTLRHKMIVSMGNLNFEILVDDAFANINTDSSLNPITNKTVLSLINDFEDGSWRYTKFQRFIWDNIAETSLSYQERESLVGEPQTTLATAAKNLRLTDKQDDISKGSELAEIVLYGLMKHHYNALPVVPKIFYKQNPQDNAKGADSVHIVIEGENDFSIWFGEAKFYNAIEDARLDAIIESVGNSIQTDKLRKENSIITNVSDIDYLIADEQLKDNIKKLLSHKESIDGLKSKLHIPILLLHECSITKGITDLTKEYKDGIIAYHKDRANSYFKKQLIKIRDVHRYSEITFHLILFPVPCKKTIVDKFVANVEHHKKQ